MFGFKDTIIPLLVFPAQLTHDRKKTARTPKGEALSQGDVNFGLIDNEPHGAERIRSTTLKPSALRHSQSRTSFVLDKSLKATRTPAKTVPELLKNRPLCVLFVKRKAAVLSSSKAKTR